MSPLKKETPLAATGGASCVGYGSPSPELHTLDAQRAQFLMLSHAVPPTRAAMLAAIVFEGSAQ